MGNAAHNLQCMPCKELPATPADKICIPRQRCLSLASPPDCGMPGKTLLEQPCIGDFDCTEKPENGWTSGPHEPVPQSIAKVPPLRLLSLNGLHSEGPQSAHNKFTVAIVGVKGLETKKWKSGHDVCVLKMLGDSTELFRTKVVDNPREPQWNEEVEVARTKDGESIEFLIYRQKTHFSFLMGRAVLENSSFESFGFNGEVELHDGKGMILGALMVKVKMDGQQEFPHPANEEEQSGLEDSIPENPLEVALAVHGAPGKPVGLSVDIQDGITAYVCEVKEGPFMRYNRRIRCRDLQLRPGDFITSVNGIKGNSEKILEQLQLSGDMEVMVCRPLEVEILFKRDIPEHNFGALVTKHPIGRTVLLDGVMEASPLDTWNRANPDDAIEAGDRIVAVDGMRGMASQLMEAIFHEKNECRVTIAKPPRQRSHLLK